MQRLIYIFETVPEYLVLYYKKWISSFIPSILVFSFFKACVIFQNMLLFLGNVYVKIDKRLF